MTRPNNQAETVAPLSHLSVCTDACTSGGVKAGGGPKSRSQSQVERLKHLCARLGAADCLCQKPEVMMR